MVRSSEMKQNEPVIQDKKAVEIMTQVETGDIIIDGGKIATHGILARTKIIDDEIKKILLDKPDITIINLGVGLDTRICRIDNSKLKCFELDMPDVITLRRKYFIENDRIRFIAKSVLDDTWTQDIGKENGNNIIIIAEGLLMYFSEEEVKRIFQLLSDNFPDATMYFDIVHSFFVGKGISSAFNWGLDKAKNIKNLSQNIQLVHSWSTGNILKSRQPLLLRIMNILPSTRNRSQILKIKFCNK
jgi:O-methyltransferase involved in polyketide biosynthesis